MRRKEAKPIGLVSIAHGFSHFYMLLLAPLFPFSNSWIGVKLSFCTCRVHCSLRVRGCALRIMALEDGGGSMLKTRLPD